IFGGDRIHSSRAGRSGAIEARGGGATARSPGKDSLTIVKLGEHSLRRGLQPRGIVDAQTVTRLAPENSEAFQAGDRAREVLWRDPQCLSELRLAHRPADHRSLRRVF